jgi:Predicted integral membrane protein
MESAQPGMNAAQECVVVKAPLNRVYEQWSRMEDLPKFIPPLREVRRIDDTHFSYVWHPNGEEKQGIFQIVLQIPGRRIAWRTMSNGFMSGVVSFEPRSEQETEVILKIRSIFDPSNLSRRVEEYLGNFKRLVERAEARA